MKSSCTSHDELSLRLHALLPQTQCTRCGYPDCAGYAQALATGEADLNQCAPGGTEGIARLADLLSRQPKPLNSVYGAEVPRMMAVINEDWCIGCTKCLDVCPTDAILGSSKRMHTVIDPYCTGCELCIHACPVDCIEMRNESGSATGWDAWSQGQASQSLARYKQHRARIAEHGRRVESIPDAEAVALLRPAVEALEKTSQTIHAATFDDHISASDRKRILVEAAMKKARAFKAL